MKKTGFLSRRCEGFAFTVVALVLLLSPPAAQADQCAIFDANTVTLQVPCFVFGEASYWLELGLAPSDSITFGISKFGLNTVPPALSECATFDALSSTLRLTCLELAGSRYWLDFALIPSDPLQLDLKQFDVRRFARGLYAYNDALGVLTLNTQSTNRADCGGPPLGVMDLPVVSTTPSAFSLLVDNDGDAGDQLLFNRTSGQGPGLVGSWWSAQGGEQMETILNEDGSFSILGNGPECATALVKRKTISVDCNFTDWSERDRIYLDTDGPDCGNVAGRDIKEVYLAQDNSFIYARFVMNGPLDPTFDYSLGVRPNFVMNMRVLMRNGRSEIQYASPGVGGTFTSSSVCVSGNQFEFRVAKSDVKPFWAGQRMTAFCSQGSTSVCIDFIELPVLDFGL